MYIYRNNLCLLIEGDKYFSPTIYTRETETAVIYVFIYLQQKAGRVLVKNNYKTWLRHALLVYPFSFPAEDHRSPVNWAGLYCLPFTFGFHDSHLRSVGSFTVSVMSSRKLLCSHQRQLARHSEMRCMWSLPASYVKSCVAMIFQKQAWLSARYWYNFVFFP